MTMDRDEIKSAVEALLFITEKLKKESSIAICLGELALFLVPPQHTGAERHLPLKFKGH